MPVTSKIPEETDVLVVGSGPGGLAAAKTLADGAPGRRVTLIDARLSIGSPVRCGEMSCATLFEIIGFERRPEWVRWELPKSDDMIVLDRSRMEHDMSRLLAKQGVGVHERTSLVAIEPYRDGARWVTLSTPEGPRRLRARMVIAADGVSSQTARLAGLKTGLKPDELCSCLAVRVEQAKLKEPDGYHFDFFDELAPFYFWVIPSGRDEANVGLGIRSSQGADLHGMLDRILETTDWVAGGTVTERIMGNYPSTTPMPEPYADGLLVVGGAARFVGAITGEGIRQAAVTGRAAAVLLLKLGDGPVLAEDLAPYPELVAPLFEELHKEARDKKARFPRRPAAAGHARPRSAGRPRPKAYPTSSCVGCTGCVPTCPPMAIRVVPSGVEVVEEVCTGCGICMKDCAVLGMAFPQIEVATLPPGKPA